MGAKQEQATETKFCVLLEVEGWEAVVYVHLHTAYELVRLTALAMSNTLSKSEEDVEAALLRHRRVEVHEVHDGHVTKGFYTFRRVAFVDTEVTE